MRPNTLPSFSQASAFLLSLCLATVAAAATNSAASSPADAGNVPPPAPTSCWEITGPFIDGKETYFDASNGCDSPRHCQVWVNGQEPPHMVHLEPGTSGRIDVGGAEPGDTYAQDCVPIGVYGEHGD